MTVHHSRRRRVALVSLLVAAGALVASIALADDESDRRGYLSEIDSKLSSAASELSGAKSDSDDGDIRDADGYVDQVKDLVSRLDRVKGDDAKAREVASSRTSTRRPSRPASTSSRPPSIRRCARRSTGSGPARARRSTC